MTIDVITLFPKIIETYVNESILKRAQEKGLLEVNLVNLRDFGLGTHLQVDDTPYGGGAGMVIRADVAAAAVNSRQRKQKALVINFSPKGKRLNQKLALKLALEKHLILFNPHYEGVDQRFIDKYV